MKICEVLCLNLLLLEFFNVLFFNHIISIHTPSRRYETISNSEQTNSTTEQTILILVKSSHQEASKLININRGMSDEGYFARLASDGEMDDATNGLQDLEDRTIYLRERLDDVFAELERHKADSKMQMNQMTASVWALKKELEGVKKDSKKQIDELQVKIRRLEKRYQGARETGSASQNLPVTVKRNRSTSPGDKALQATAYTDINSSSQSKSKVFALPGQELRNRPTMGNVERAMAMSRLKEQMTNTQTRSNPTIDTARNNVPELLRLLNRPHLWSITKEDIEQELDMAAVNKEQLLYTLLDIQSLLHSNSLGKSLIPNTATIFCDIRKAAAKRIGNSGLPSWHLTADAVQVLQGYKTLLQDRKIKTESR
jgi:hypothetical protein